MSFCFVIQPFDQGEYDERYDDIFSPAIKEAGLTPYRVDRDPSVNIIIEEIESKIKVASLCLADITLPNSNVWYEIGYATASGKDVIFVCLEEVSNFPFDVQHRKIIRYKKSSTSSFNKLQKEITERIVALMRNEKTIERFSSESPIKETQGLLQPEIVVLISIMQNRTALNGGVIGYSIHSDLERAGFNNLASNIALTTLSRKEMITSSEAIRCTHLIVLKANPHTEI